MRLLEVLGARTGGGSEGLSVSACVEASGIPRATCHRLLNALVSAGYVRRLTRGRYVLGWRMQMLCQAVAESSPLAGATPVLQALVARTGQTAHLGVLDGPVAVYLACVDSPSSVRLAARPGSRIPLNVSAIGMAVAACLPERELEALLRGTSWEARTSASLRDADALLAELRGVRRRGYAVDEGGYALGVRCLAAPVRGPGGRALAAVGITSLASELDVADPHPVAAVREAAELLAASADRPLPNRTAGRAAPGGLEGGDAVPPRMG